MCSVERVEAPVACGAKRSVVFADTKSVVFADRTSAVSADRKSVVCQDIPILLTTQGGHPPDFNRF